MSVYFVEVSSGKVAAYSEVVETPLNVDMCGWVYMIAQGGW